MGVGEMWCQIFAKYVLQVPGYEATYACKDGQLCAGFKDGINGAVHGVKSIWGANTTSRLSIQGTTVTGTVPTATEF